MSWRVVLAALSVTVGVWAQEAADLRSVVSAPEQEVAAPAVETPQDPIEAAIQTMSLEQKIAQLMFVTFESGQNPSSGERRLLKGYTPGGVYLASVRSPAAFEQFVHDLRMNPVELQYRVPILIGTNFYGLSSQRHTGTPYAPLPSPLALGASHDEAVMADAAGLIADYMTALGVGVHFGPGLALSSRLEGTHPSLFQFGEDPELVAMGARAFGEAFREKGVNWMPMGFPGGGANRTNGSPAVLVTPRSTLDERDLLPYTEAIQAGARFVQVGNVLVPTLENDPVPASVSYSVLTNLLRKELEFDGIVVAGPMDDPDLTRYYQGPDAPTRALMAGADMVWWGSPGPRPEQFVGRLAVAVQQNEVPLSLVNQRLRHVLQVKAELGLLQKPLPDSRQIDKLIKAQEKNGLASRLEEAGIVFLKASPGMFPISNQLSVPLGITGVAGVEELYTALKDEKIEPIARHGIGTAQHGKQVFGFEIERLLKGAEGTRTLLCVFSSEVSGPTQREVLRQFKQRGARTITVLLGIPDDIDKYFDESDALIVVLRPAEGSMSAAMKAVANVMLGRGSVRILEPKRDLVAAPGQNIGFDIGGIAVTPAARLPVTVSEQLPAGYGIGFSAPMDKRTVQWDFGDANVGTGPNVEHAYGAPGRYTLNVGVSQDGDTIAEGAFNIVVKAPD